MNITTHVAVATSGLIVLGASAAAVAAAVPAGAAVVAAAPQPGTPCEAGTDPSGPAAAGGVVELKPGQSHRTPGGACVAWSGGKEIMVREQEPASVRAPRVETWRIQKASNAVAFTRCEGSEPLATRNAVFELQDGVARLGVMTDGTAVTAVRVFPEAAAFNNANLRGFSPRRDAYYAPNGCEKMHVGVISENF
jgi:hypothetical protein